MKGNWVFYMLLLVVATVAEAGAETGPYPNNPVQIMRIRRLAAPRMWRCGSLPMG